MYNTCSMSGIIVLSLVYFKHLDTIHRTICLGRLEAIGKAKCNQRYSSSTNETLITATFYQLYTVSLLLSIVVYHIFFLIVAIDAHAFIHSLLSPAFLSISRTSTPVQWHRWCYRCCCIIVMYEYSVYLHLSPIITMNEMVR